MSRFPRRVSALILFALVVATVAAPAARQPALDASEASALRRQLEARFEVVPLARGLGLVPRESRGLIEIDEGVVSIEGRPLSGAELRDRFGGDAPLLLRLSYLTNADLRLLLPPPVPPPAAVPPPPPVALATPAPAPPPSVAPAPPAAPETPARVYRRTGARIGIGRSITIAEDEEVAEGVFVLGGRLHIAGRVRNDIVVVGGRVELAPTADVLGDITVIGGSVDRAPGARLSGRINEAEIGTWRGDRWSGVWWPRLEFGGWISFAGTLLRIVLLALAVAVIALVARRPVLRVGDAATAAPLRAALFGLGAQILFVPILIIASIALAVTLIGIPFVAVLVPLAIGAAVGAMLLGFTGIAARVGAFVAARFGGDGGGLVLAAWLGLGLLVLPALLARTIDVLPGPFHLVAFSMLVGGVIIEYVAWTIGLGAALMTGFGRSSAVPPPVPSPVPDEPPPPPPPTEPSQVSLER